jgi:hypothetical protein
VQEHVRDEHPGVREIVHPIRGYGKKVDERIIARRGRSAVHDDQQETDQVDKNKKGNIENDNPRQGVALTELPLYIVPNGSEHSLKQIAGAVFLILVFG